MIGGHPAALEIRRLQTISEVGAEHNSTTVLMIPGESSPPRRRSRRSGGQPRLNRPSLHHRVYRSEFVVLCDQLARRATIARRFSLRSTATHAAEGFAQLADPTSTVGGTAVPAKLVNQYNQTKH